MLQFTAVLEARSFQDRGDGSHNEGDGRGERSMGYVQGMSYLAAVLILHTMSDHAAFAYLAAILQQPFVRCFYT
jgi:hypothetical protein